MTDASGWSPGRELHSVTLRLLDAVVAVHSDDATVAATVAELYHATVTTARADHQLLLVRSDVGGSPGCVVTVDGSVVVRTTAPAIAFTNLVFELNQLVIRTTAGLRLHAGAVATDAGGVVIAGAMGAGKSTLTAGLVRRGARYLTDEVAAFAPGSRAVRPYAKPLSLPRPPVGLQDLWRPDAAAARLVGAGGLVPPACVGPVAPDPVTLRTLVLPRYEPGASVAVERLEPDDAIVAVASHTFELDRPGTLDRVAAALEGVAVWSLVSGDLEEACASVLDHVNAARV